jgi:hypothetical protein
MFDARSVIRRPSKGTLQARSRTLTGHSLQAAYRRMIHVVLDNSTPRVQFHFTPTRASWLKQVASWFSILKKKSLHGVFLPSVKQLGYRIDAFIEAYKKLTVSSMPSCSFGPRPRCIAFAAASFLAESRRRRVRPCTRSAPPIFKPKDLASQLCVAK